MKPEPRAPTSGTIPGNGRSFIEMPNVTSITEVVNSHGVIPPSEDMEVADYIHGAVTTETYLNWEFDDTGPVPGLRRHDNSNFGIWQENDLFTITGEFLEPTLTSLTPDTAVWGPDEPDIVMVVNGTNLSPYAVILWDTNEEPTVYVSPTEVTTIVKPSTATGPYTIAVRLQNPGALPSNALSFIFTDPPPLEEETP